MWEMAPIKYLQLHHFICSMEPRSHAHLLGYSNCQMDEGRRERATTLHNFMWLPMRLAFNISSSLCAIILLPVALTSSTCMGLEQEARP